MKKRILYSPVALLTFTIAVLLSPVRFWPQSIACGPRSSSTVYLSSHLVSVSSSYSEYPSVEEARAEFQSRLAKAAQVIELTPKVDKEGQNVGGRAVLVLGGTDRRYALVWTNKKVVHSVTSTSLGHVLEFKSDSD